MDRPALTQTQIDNLLALHERRVARQKEAQSRYYERHAAERKAYAKGYYQRIKEARAAAETPVTPLKEESG
jgi:hypothetical protein